MPSPRSSTLLLALLALLAVTLLGPAAVAASAGPTGSTGFSPASRFDSLERGVVAEINDVRRQHGLPPLRASRSLSEAANAHSEAMARTGFFGHSSSDGTAFWKRVKLFYGVRNFGVWSVGENLLWASPTIDPGQAVQKWLDSPPHRRNILTAAWREVGLAAVSVETAPGVFSGLPVTIITADFGVRK